MRRFLVVFVLCLVAVSASASYKIFLVSGETILADEKPQVKEGMAFFIKGGVTFNLPASRIDFEKSEKTALTEAAGQEIEQIVTTDRPSSRPAKGAPVRKVDDESLDKIRQRSRLANEGEFVPPEAEGPSAGVIPGEEKAPGAGPDDAHAQAQERVRQAEQNVARAESERNQMRNSVLDLKQRYDSSVQQEDKSALWSQYESARESLTAANSKVDEANAQLGTARSEMNSMPVVVEIPQEPGK